MTVTWRADLRRLKKVCTSDFKQFCRVRCSPCNCQFIFRLCISTVLHDRSPIVKETCISTVEHCYFKLAEEATHCSKQGEFVIADTVHEVND